MKVSIDYAPIADLYDALVGFEDDIPFFLEEADRSSGPVLELMCGTGRISMPLLEAGIPVTCVDYSTEMLAVLRKKIKARGLPGRVVHADIRELDLGERFELAILPFHSFAELITEADQLTALGSIHGALTDGGRFICTLHNPALRLRGIDGEWHTLGSIQHPSSAGKVVFRTKLDFDPDTRLASGVQTIDEYDGDGGLIGQRSMDMRFALPERQAFEALATSSGFRIASLCGDYDRSEYRGEESPYMIWTLVSAD